MMSTRDFTFEAANSVWPAEDSARGPTKFLMKRKAFFLVSLYSFTRYGFLKNFNPI